MPKITFFINTITFIILSLVTMFLSPGFIIIIKDNCISYGPFDCAPYLGLDIWMGFSTLIAFGFLIVSLINFIFSKLVSKKQKISS